MKITKIKSLLVVLLGVLVFAACKQEPPTQPSCDLQAKFVEVEWANGYYGKYLIQLEDGTLLYPCAVNNNPIFQRDIYDGMPITVSYRALINEEIACRGFEDKNTIAEGGCVLNIIKARITCINDKQTDCGTKGGGWCGTEL